ncbi:MAG: hypothetical protein EKK37_04855 [Sphingobacteriales bacterium]|nr:MAG: hypothetical protein EKK37_04855 [Sphingobacteriales bacterium]
MKKLFILFFLSLFLFSCNSETTRENNTDSSSAKEPVPLNDSTNVHPGDSINTIIKPAPDSLKPVSIRFGDNKTRDSTR